VSKVSPPIKGSANARALINAFGWSGTALDVAVTIDAVAASGWDEAVRPSGPSALLFMNSSIGAGHAQTPVKFQAKNASSE
jgi:hypothetical protein